MVQKRRGGKKEVKKAIFAIGIVSMFLLTSLTVVSVTGKKANFTITSGEGIDLLLIVTRVRPTFTGLGLYREFDGYSATIHIINLGNAPMEKSEYPNFMIRQTAEYDGEEVYNRTFNSWKHHEIGDSLEPGEVIGWSLLWNVDHVPPKSTLTVFVDPDNLIPEWNDYENNYWEGIGPKVRSKNLFIFDFLECFPNAFPVLRYLIGL